MHKYISSTQNPSVRRLLQLQEKSRFRKKEGGFIIEGLREIKLAIIGGYHLTELYIKESQQEDTAIKDIITSLKNAVVISLSDDIYRKVAYRDGTEGIIAFAKAKKTLIPDLDLPKTPLLLIAEAPEKPGNIGALLRTADAAGVDAFILANYLQEKNINIYSAILQEAVPYDTQDYKGATAIVVGTEATGLSEPWREASTQNIIIPMQGAIDSMNVSVAAGILIFEARRVFEIWFL